MTLVLSGSRFQFSLHSVQWLLIFRNQQSVSGFCFILIKFNIVHVFLTFAFTKLTQLINKLAHSVCIKMDSLLIVFDYTQTAFLVKRCNKKLGN